MAAQYELLKELLNSGTKLSFGQDFFFKFYQAFLLRTYKRILGIEKLKF